MFVGYRGGFCEPTRIAQSLPVGHTVRIRFEKGPIYSGTAPRLTTSIPCRVCPARSLADGEDVAGHGHGAVLPSTSAVVLRGESLPAVGFVLAVSSAAWWALRQRQLLRGPILNLMAFLPEPLLLRRSFHATTATGGVGWSFPCLFLRIPTVKRPRGGIHIALLACPRPSNKCAGTNPLLSVASASGIATSHR